MLKAIPIGASKSRVFTAARAGNPSAVPIASVSLLLFAASGLLFAASNQADTLAVVTSQSGQNSNDSVQWSQLGADGTVLGSNFNVHSVSGIAVGVGLSGPNSIVSVVCSSSPASSCSWTGRNATASDTLLWTSDASNGGTGPLTLSFSTGVAGAGAVIQADAPGIFTAQIQAFNGTTSLGSFTLTSDANGDPLYIGVTDQSGANITSVAFTLTACTDLMGVCNDFALDTVSVSNAAVSVNPSGLTFSGQAVQTTSAPQTVTLTNFTSSALTITSIATSGDFAQTSTCGASVAANGSCTISVTFTPTVSGIRTGALTITDSASNSPQTVNLTGSGPASAATLSPGSLTFAGQLVGTTSAAMSVTLSNPGTTTLNVSNVATTGDFAQTNNCNGSVAAGGSCTISVTFTPSTTGVRAGTLTVTDDASTSPQSINLSGTGTAPAASVAPNVVTFGGQVVSTTSAPHVVTLGNSGTAPLTITAIATTGDFAQTNNCKGSVAAGSSCAINVTFTPTTTGTRTGNLTITDSASGSPQSASLTGTGTDPAVSLSTTSLTFSSQPVGTTSSGQNVTLTNSGTAPLSIGNIVMTGDYAETDDCPATLPPNSNNSCTITVTFTPTASGTRAGSLTITDNALNSPQSVSLTGTGSTPPAASLTPTNGLNFSNQLVGSTSAAQAVTVTNTGGQTLTLSGISTTGTNAADFSIASGGTCTSSSSLAPSASCTINVTFKPSATGPRSASISVADNASGSPQSVPLSGTGTSPAASFNPTSLGFGNQNVGSTSSAQSTTLTNSGTATLVLSGISITGTNASDFSVSGGTCTSSSSLAPSASCTISVTFKPGAAGSRSASISVADNASGSPQSVPLSGTGTSPAASFNPTSLGFGNQNVGTTSSAHSTTLTNSGTSTLTLSGISISGTNATDFSIASGGTCTSSSSLAPSASCTISVTFKPGAAGARSASISVADNASGSPQSVPLSGTGTSPAASFNPTSLGFGNQNVGSTSSAQSTTLTNSGTATLVLSGISITGTNASDFSVSGGTCTSSSSLAPSASCTISVTFKPGAAGSRSAGISVADNASGSPQSVPLSGTGTSPAASFNPTSLGFGNQNVGTTSSAHLTTLTNSGTSTLTLSGISISGTNATDFSIASGGTCTSSSSLAPAASCTINVTFKPGAAGARSAGISVADNASGSPQSVPLSGTGTSPSASFNPTSLGFGNQNVGTTSSAHSTTLTNSGTATLTLSGISISGTNATDFSIASGGTCTSSSSLAPAASCTINVTFKPGAAGARSAGISVADNASGSPQSVPLSGTGTSPAASFNPTSLGFGNQNVGTTSSAHLTTLTNSGTSTLTLSGISISGTNATDFSIASGGTCTSSSSLAPAASCTINVTFKPGAAGARSAGISVTDNVSGSPQSVPLSGTGTSPSASFNPTSLGFGNQNVGTTSSAHSTTLTNSGTATLTLSGISISGTNATDFSIASGGTCTSSSSLAPAASCTINVTFKPGAAGARSAGISVADNASGSPQSVPLSGTGTSPAASFNPTSLGFGNQNVGTTSSAHLTTLTNSGTSTLTLSGISITGTNATDFSIASGGTCTSSSSLAPAASCTINVTFKPGAAGARSAGISVADNASGSPQSVPLSGTGTSPAASFNPTSLGFGNQNVGTTSSAHLTTLTNSGTSTLTLSGISITGTNAADFSIAAGGTCTSTSSLAPSRTCTINVTFKPSAPGARSASLSVTDNASGSPQSVPLSGTGIGARVSFNPTSVGFGNQNVGTTSSAHSTTLTNSGNATLTLTGIHVTGTNATDFNIATGGTCTSTSSLAANATCTINVTFKPTAPGARSASISVTDNASGSPQSVALSGTGIGSAVSFNPTTLGFGNQNVATTSSAHSTTLTNSGNATLTLTGIHVTGTNAIDFSIAAGGTCTSSSSLAPNAGCTIHVTFKPAATGARSASISVTDNASGSPQSLPLSGTGTSAAASMSPASLTFPSQQVGTTSGAQSVTLKNTGTATLNITSIAASTNHAETNNCGSSIAAGSSCTISVTFKPLSVGTLTGSLKVTDNASGSPQSISLTGGSTPANGTYTTTNSAGTLAWDDPGFAKGNGTLIDLYKATGGTNQKWTFTSVGSGSYTITNVNTGLALDERGFNTAPGTKLDQWTYGGTANQQWLLTPSGTGYTISCRYSGLFVDASSNTQGTNIIQAKASGASSQVWNIH